MVRTGQEGVATTIRQRNGKWIDHTLRKEKEHQNGREEEPLTRQENLQMLAHVSKIRKKGINVNKPYK